MDIDVSAFLKSIVTEDFTLVAVVTFFLCEGLFRALPDLQARLKQLTALAVGGVLGFFIIPNDQLLYSVLHGVLAGGAATTIVAKFKKPSAGAENPAAAESLVEHPHV
jgi:hypothetical protein